MRDRNVPASEGTLQKYLETVVSKAARSNEHGFQVTDKLEEVERILQEAESPYYVVRKSEQSWIFGRRRMEEGQSVTVVSTHADIVDEIKRPYSSLDTDRDYYRGTYDNGGTNAVCAHLMATEELPENVYFAFTAEEETGSCTGAEDVLSFVRGITGREPIVLALDVTDEGYEDNRLFTVEGLHGVNEMSRCKMLEVFLGTEGERQSFEVVRLREEDDNSFLPEKYRSRNLTVFDESVFYANSGCNSCSLCLPGTGEMHGDEGFQVKRAVMEGYEASLLAIILAFGGGQPERIEALKARKDALVKKAAMQYLEERNQKIIDAVIEKADRVCPGALALIGIYGSFMTGDYHEKSDLDLLIVINDDRGWQLGSAFIQDDLQVGHDIYCTTWERLQDDARYEHPNISKLMDARIVYCAGEKDRERLELLRKAAQDILTAPFSEEDYAKAEKLLKEAEHCFALAMTAERKSDVLEGAGGAIYYIENAIAMLNKQYFHDGVKRAYEELNAMSIRPEKLCDRIEDVVSATSVVSLQEHLSTLMRETMAVFRNVKETIAMQGKVATKDALTGTYEEMYSNWRNKLYLAAETGNRHLAFMSLISADAMLSEIGSEVSIDRYDVMGGYDAQDLHRTANAYDSVLAEYRKEYSKVGLQVNRYSDIDAFVCGYQAMN